MKNPFKYKIKPIKCNCSDKSCPYYVLNVGVFYTGTGFTFKQARFISKLINDSRKVTK